MMSSDEPEMKRDTPTFTPYEIIRKRCCISAWFPKSSLPKLVTMTSSFDSRVWYYEAAKIYAETEVAQLFATVGVAAIKRPFFC